MAWQIDHNARLETGDTGTGTRGKTFDICPIFIVIRMVGDILRPCMVASGHWGIISRWRSASNWGFVSLPIRWLVLGESRLRSGDGRSARCRLRGSDCRRRPSRRTCAIRLRNKRLWNFYSFRLIQFSGQLFWPVVYYSILSRLYRTKVNLFRI